MENKSVKYHQYPSKTALLLLLLTFWHRINFTCFGFGFKEGKT